MSEKVFVQYLGFEAKALVREYVFDVRAVSGEPLEYTLAMENEALTSHRVRYQDAPAICSLKLQRELASYAKPPSTNPLPHR